MFVNKVSLPVLSPDNISFNTEHVQWTELRGKHLRNVQESCDWFGQHWTNSDGKHTIFESLKP